MKIRFLLLGLALLGAALNARSETWETDYAKALNTARADKKMVLLDFTGSDWCVFCVQLDKEVFSQPEFKEFAEKNLVLVKLDYPHDIALPETLVRQNEKLRGEYGIEGYPTVIVLNEAGKKVGEVEYQEGGPAKFIAAIKALPKG